MIFHITNHDAWQQALTTGIYTADSLETEGFIHCSTVEQVIQTANRFYAGQIGLVLLVIDNDKLEAELIYEESEPGQFFPHLYGSLNLGAVIQVLDFPPDPDGSFNLPNQLLTNSIQQENDMTTLPTLPGITSQFIDTDRIRFHILTCGPDDGVPVMFIHGNFSASTYWEEIMLALPNGYKAIAPDLRGYGSTEDKLIDATRGSGDWSDDLAGLFQALDLDQAHLVGWSLGGGVLYRFLGDHPERVRSLTLINPVSPFGFGGTKGIEGVPCYPDFAGSGGGVVNPEFVKRIIEQDRSADDPNSPRNVISAFYYKAPFSAAREEDFLTAALQEKMGDDRYPGDFVASDNWPNVAPGQWGPINAGSPKYVLDDLPALVALQAKPPILWIRGSDDMIVSDNSMFDFGALGKMGFVPAWPGDDIYPPQPMVSQTRFALEQYAEAGGWFEEKVIEDTAHSPHIEKPETFNELFHRFLADQ